MRLIYVLLPNSLGASVILNGTTVYHEDDDDGYSQNFTALELADRLATALGLQVEEVNLTWDDIDEEEWNFDDVEEAALKKSGTTSKNDYQLLREAVIDYANNSGFKNATMFPDTLIRNRKNGR